MDPIITGQSISVFDIFTYMIPTTDNIPETIQIFGFAIVTPRKSKYSDGN